MNLDQRPVHGPYDTDDEIQADIEHVYAAVADHEDERAAGYTLMHRINEGLLLGALKVAGVHVGGAEFPFARWVAARDPEYALVVASWIERARAARDEELQTEIDALKAQIDSLATQVRHAAPVEFDLDDALAIAERRLG